MEKGIKGKTYDKNLMSLGLLLFLQKVFNFQFSKCEIDIIQFISVRPQKKVLF